MPLWEQDFRVPLAFGFKHCLGENGGPGAMFHALRNYEIVLPICRDVERLCPQALVLNFTNPESRILMAMCHLTRVRAVGLCHGVLMARNDAARWLGRDPADLDIVTGGLNHLFWILKITDRATGEDLYPALREQAARHAPPLVRKLTEIYDLLVFPSDDHVGEYLSFATEFTGIRWPYGQEHGPVPAAETPPVDWREAYLAGEKEADERLARPGGEIVVDIIADVVNDTGRWEPTVNVPNTGGYVENLPREAVVEVPAVVDAAGVHPADGRSAARGPGRPVPHASLHPAGAGRGVPPAVAETAAPGPAARPVRRQRPPGRGDARHDARTPEGLPAQVPVGPRPGAANPPLCVVGPRTHHADRSLASRVAGAGTRHAKTLGSGGVAGLPLPHGRGSVSPP